jgi:hypothetical protein
MFLGTCKIQLGTYKTLLITCDIKVLGWKMQLGTFRIQLANLPVFIVVGAVPITLSLLLIKHSSSGGGEDSL